MIYDAQKEREEFNNSYRNELDFQQGSSAVRVSIADFWLSRIETLLKEKEDMLEIIIENYWHFYRKERGYNPTGEDLKNFILEKNRQDLPQSNT